MSWLHSLIVAWATAHSKKDYCLLKALTDCSKLLILVKLHNLALAVVIKVEINWINEEFDEIFSFYNKLIS